MIKVSRLLLSYQKLAGWLLPDGTFIPLKDGKIHEDIIYEHFLEDLKSNPDMTGVGVGLEKGWIRLWLAGGTLNIQTKNIDQSFLLRVQKFISENDDWYQAKRVLVESGNEAYSLTFDEFISANKVNEIKRLVA